MAKKRRANGTTPMKSRKPSNVNRVINEIKQMAMNDKNVAKKRTKNIPKVSEASQFGPVSTIATAPVAIGNSVRGAAKNITRTKAGVRIRGRDFMFAPIGTVATVTNWSVVGGSPLTPAAFADSIIANYQRMYMRFKFHSFVVHYITSSPTSANGDVLFYYSKDRTSVFLNQTSNQFLPFIFTDQNTVMGPQWTNHSARFAVTGDWKLTDYGMHDGVEEYADGELFLLSKTSTVDSPGYVIFDYDLEFAEECFQPRLLTFPIPRIQWRNISFGLTTTAVTKDSTFYGVIQGSNLSGVASAMPANTAVGDIYKIIIDVTNSDVASWVNVTASNLMEDAVFNADQAFVMTDGFTAYAVWNGSFLNLFQNATAAYVAQSLLNPASNGNSSLAYGVAATVTYTLQAWVSYVGSVTHTANLPNF